MEKSLSSLVVIGSLQTRCITAIFWTEVFLNMLLKKKIKLNRFYKLNPAFSIAHSSSFIFSEYFLHVKNMFYIFHFSMNA